MHLLDLAGPLQVFYEAGTFGEPYEIVYVSQRSRETVAAQLSVHDLHLLDEVNPASNDLIFIPGFRVDRFATEENQALFSWLRAAYRNGSILCSVCTGAFALAAAGLLDNRACTTHWKYIDALQARYPTARVQRDKLFINEGTLYTSAGVTTGIDLALHLIEQRHGPELAYKIAREIVVYNRRNGDQEQQSAFLLNRDHFVSRVHALQDWLVSNLDKKLTLDLLADVIHTSPRNLTRLFKATTGITVGKYVENLRVEKAVQLLKQGQKVEFVTAKCGLKHAAQLRRLLRKDGQALPTALKKLS